MPAPKDPVKKEEWRKRQSEDAIYRYIKYPNLKKQLSEKMKGRKLPPFSKEWRDNISKSAKGRPKTEEHKKNIAISLTGRKQSEATRRKRSESLRGENAPNWQGGITDDPYPEDWTDDLRESIRKRDSYVCQLCGLHQDELFGYNKKLDVHHIDYNKDNLDPAWLVSLCRGCHLKTNYNREYWIHYFKGLKSDK